MASVFDLVATLALDSSQYENGLKSAQSSASTIGGAIGKGFGTIAKVGVAAIGAATTAVVGFGAASVKTGASFDTAMSQVAATMGKTSGEITDLRDFAKEMGATTAFSATEAAEALNYMALAGYDSEKSMAMLPNVLNLAAAGAMDLGAASDMITDTQSALGLSMEETTALVDKMAAASSNSNTSVSQLGQAMLTIGGTAKNLSGGTTELSQALGILADNGVKGAEGGTALRNILLNLTPKSEDAAEAFEQLGLNAYDANGKMRPLKDVFADLNKGMEGMTDEEKTNILSNIFNKVDLKSVNALLATNADRWDELSVAIDGSGGAAERMAKEQLNNLEGQLKLLESAFQGVQIEVSEKVMPALIDFVNIGSDGLSKMASAIKEGDMSGAIDAFSNVLTEGLTKIVSGLPQAIDVGMQILGALADGIVRNIPTIGAAAVEIITTISDSLTSAIPNIMSSGTDIITGLFDGLTAALDTMTTIGIDIITSLTQGIQENLPTMIATGLTALMDFTANLRSNVGSLVDAGLAMIMAIADGLIQNLPVMIQTIPTIISNIAGIINDNAPKLLMAGVQLLGQLAIGIVEAVPTLIEEFPKILKAIWDVIVAFNWIALGGNIITLIKDGVTALATAIPDALKSIGESALNLFRSINWANLGTSLINAIVGGITSLMSAIPSLLQSIGTTAINLFKSIDWLSVGVEVINFIVNGVTAVSSLIPTLLQTIGTTALNLFKSIDWKGLGTAVINFIVNGVKGIGKNISTTLQTLGKNALNTFKSIDWKNLGRTIIEFIINGAKNIGNNVATTLRSIGQKGLESIKKIDWKALGRNMIEGIVNGVKAATSKLVNALKDVAKKALDSAKSALGIKSPSRVMRDQVGKNISLGIATGIEQNTKAIESAMNDATDIVTDMPVSVVGSKGKKAEGGSIASNNVVINVYGAVGQDVEELAEIIEQKIAEATLRRDRAFA